MYQYVIAGIAGVAVFLVARLLSGSKLPVLSPDARGLVVGDSLTAHGGYQRTLAGLLPYRRWRNVSEVGAGTGRIRKLLEAASVAYGPGDAIVMAGINDIASGRPLELIQTNLLALYDYLKQRNYRVIACTATPWAGYSRFTPAMGRKQEALNAWIRSKPGNVDAVVSTDSLGDRSKRLLSEYDSGDHLHLNNAGQIKLGRMILNQVYGIDLDYPTR